MINTLKNPKLLVKEYVFKLPSPNAIGTHKAYAPISCMCTGSILSCMLFKSLPRRPVEFPGWALASPRPIAVLRPPCSRSRLLGAIWRCLRPEWPEADAARACACAHGRGKGAAREREKRCARGRGSEKGAVRRRGKGCRGFARQRDRRESSTGRKSGAYISRKVKTHLFHALLSSIQASLPLLH
jgi:hypothetical protein